MKKEYKFIDLFAGCGGLSEGFYQNGFKSLVHIEFNEAACKTLKTRMRYYGYSQKVIDSTVLCEDITSKDIIKKMDKVIDDKVDVIIGGPPCQAFSTVGRAQDPNSMSDDPRNYLFENYLKVLNHYKPKLFVFENVRGMLSARPNGINIFQEIMSKMSKTYRVITDPKVLLLNSVEYGVPQIRERVIIIGVRNDLNTNPQEIYDRIKKTHYADDLNDIKGLKKYLTVRDAIADLPKILPGEGKEIAKYSNKNLNEYLKIIRFDCDNKIYNHVARNHNSLDRERYKYLSKNNWQLKDLIKERPDLVHYDPKHFGNRYTVQSYDKPGKTIVAHLYKDGNLFIHPDAKQERTFTVREAARIQSFPDNFIFEGSRTEQYKQVGNAVPPLMAKAIAKAILEQLEEMENA